MKKVYVWLASLFVSFALVSMGVMASAESVAQAPADVISEDVSFANTDSGLTLSGILYTPAEMTRDALNPAIIVTGPMLSVKEQAQSVYAQRLAAEGYVTLVFDYSTFGESEGETRSMEVPDLKASAMPLLSRRGLVMWTMSASAASVSVALELYALCGALRTVHQGSRLHRSRDNDGFVYLPSR